MLDVGRVGHKHTKRGEKHTAQQENKTSNALTLKSKRGAD